MLWYSGLVSWKATCGLVPGRRRSMHNFMIPWQCDAALLRDRKTMELAII